MESFCKDIYTIRSNQARNLEALMTCSDLCRYGTVHVIKTCLILVDFTLFRFCLFSPVFVSVSGSP